MHSPDNGRAPESEVPEAKLPQAPPGAPEGHDGSAPGAGEPADADPTRDATETAAEADANAGQAQDPGQAQAQVPGGGGDPAAAFEQAGDELDALTAKAAKADEYLQLAQRTQADFENYRKRAARDARLAAERGAVKLAQSLLPAVDNLERALEHAPEGEDDHFVKGIRHVHSDVVAALQKAGIERYSPEGEPFDPTLHEAVAQQPAEGSEPGTVVEVFQRGYRMGEQVVRPARVVVAG